MSIQDIVHHIEKIENNQNLTVNETEEVFQELLKSDGEGSYFLRFFKALHTKGETAEELLGLCKAIRAHFPSIELNVDKEKIIDLSGTGGAKLKTINVSTAASFIVAAAGFYVGKQTMFGITSITGSADVLAAFGIPLGFLKSVSPSDVKKSIESIGICPFLKDSYAPGLHNLANFARRNSEEFKQINAMYLIMNVVSPIAMRKRIYGVYGERYLEILAELLQKLGYSRGMVVYGEDGLCEVSNIGTTKVVEFDGGLKKYSLTPSDFGLKKYAYQDIKAISIDQNIIDF